MKATKLDIWLKAKNACRPAKKWAAGKTWEEVYNTCDRGEWLCWLFWRTNPEDKRLLTLVKGLQANEIRFLLKDDRSINRVDTVIAYGKGEATDDDLRTAADDADITDAAYAAAIDAAYASSAAAARRKNLAISADIFRANIPIEKINRVWEQQ